MLRPLPNTDPYRAMRAILKRLLRSHGMQALAVREMTEGEHEQKPLAHD
jgi:hypothetical protein